MSKPKIAIEKSYNSDTGKCAVNFTIGGNSTVDKIRFVYKKDSVPKNDTDGEWVERDNVQVSSKPYLSYTDSLAEEGIYYGRLFAYNSDGVSQSTSFKMKFTRPRYTTFIKFSDLFHNANDIDRLIESKRNGTLEPVSIYIKHEYRKDRENVCLDYIEAQDGFSEQMPDDYTLMLCGSVGNYGMRIRIQDYFNSDNASKSKEEKLAWTNMNIKQLLPEHLIDYISNYDVKDNDIYFTITI